MNLTDLSFRASGRLRPEPRASKRLGPGPRASERLRPGRRISERLGPRFGPLKDRGPAQACERLGPEPKEDRIEFHNWLPKNLVGGIKRKRKLSPGLKKKGKIGSESPRVFRPKNVRPWVVDFSSKLCTKLNL